MSLAGACGLSWHGELSPDTVQCIARDRVRPVGASMAAGWVDMSGGGGAALRLSLMASPLGLAVVVPGGRHCA